MAKQLELTNWNTDLIHRVDRVLKLLRVKNMAKEVHSSVADAFSSMLQLEWHEKKRSKSLAMAAECYHLYVQSSIVSVLGL